MAQSKHYQLKKKYFELLAADPDYPAWQDFEHIDGFGFWSRLTNQPSWVSKNYRYSPLPKKWEPKDGWTAARVKVTSLTDEDFTKLQAYATKLSWLREQGGYEFKAVTDNYFIDIDCDKAKTISTRINYNNDDIIFMKKEQAEKWLEMLKNGEV